MLREYLHFGLPYREACYASKGFMTIICRSDIYDSLIKCGWERCDNDDDWDDDDDYVKDYNGFRHVITIHEIRCLDGTLKSKLYLRKRKFKL